jgi:small subunit ribosomal protein S13
MFDSVLPFYKKSKKKNKKNFKFNNLNLFQFFRQRTGIGKKISNNIFLYSGFHRSTKFEYVENKNYYVLLRYKDFFVNKKLFLDSNLEDEIKKNIKGYINLYNFRGRRHKSGMPVRGQRIKTNAKTARKLRFI